METRELEILNSKITAKTMNWNYQINIQFNTTVNELKTYHQTICYTVHTNRTTIIQITNSAQAYISHNSGKLRFFQQSCDFEY
jgi:hypothetical protein